MHLQKTSTSVVLVIVAALMAAAADDAWCADTEVISAERPGFSSSPVALGHSLVQIEGGYQYTREAGSLDIDDHTLPLALVRVGLADNLELQLGWAGYSWTEVNGQDIDGINDAGVGVKWQISDDNGAVPFALFAGVSIPVGDDEYSSDDYDPTIGAFWAYDSSISWFGTVLVSESDNDTSLSNAIGIGLPISSEANGYVEYFGIFAEGAGPEHYLNGGLAYLARNDLQLDLHIGAGLNGRAADLFLGMGFAYRF